MKEVSIKEIDHRSRMSENSPAMTSNIIQHLDYNGMTYYGDQIILGTAQQMPELEADKNSFLQKLAPIPGSLP